MFFCPHCQVSLKKFKSPHGIIWICTTCNGRAASLFIFKKQMENQNFKKLWREIISGSGDFKNACPSCTKKMAEVPLLLQGECLFIDVCKNCKLIWFDDGEYDSVQKPPETMPEIKPLRFEDTRAKLAIAEIELMKIKNANREYQDELPDNIWKMIPAVLGFPVKEETDIESDSKPWITWGLCLLIMFISIMSFHHLKSVIMHYGLIPNQCFKNFGMTFITSFFLHADYFHLLGNLYFLFVFGVNVEEFLGKKRFVALLICGLILGDIMHILSNINSPTPCIGASGGISGVITFFALKYPHSRIGMLVGFRFWLRLPAYDFFGVWVILQLVGLYMQISGNSNISSLAHIGGATVGALFWFLTRKE